MRPHFVTRITTISTAFLLAGALAACSSDDGDDKQTSKSPTTPAASKDGGSSSGSSGSSSSGSSLGPECEAYLACCEELATKNPQLGASCDSVKKQIEDAQDKGASTDTYESSCKQATSAAQSAGYCK